ncbi:hypothetical protein N0V84_008447 [Fusarium piperis]|uniref:Protein kinase domain-containing protein n=1 Tax=Fusarium piperis TaxID=1435070 RepID=A0A9W8W8A8_9HYPO|nr:hypothetical protein N0V84_008447 [Fusarium piperis]
MLRHEHALQECPFCGGFPEEIEKLWPDRNSKPAREALEKHVRDHLIDVALILAPAGTGGPDDKSGSELDDAGSEAQRDNDSERDLDHVGDSYRLECRNGCRDCKEINKDSALNWSHFGATSRPPKGSDTLKGVDDPSYTLSGVAGEWEFCYMLSLAPDNQPTHPGVYSKPEDDETLREYFRLSGTSPRAAWRDFDRAIENSAQTHGDDVPAALRDVKSVLPDKIKGPWDTKIKDLFTARELDIDHLVHPITAFSRGQGQEKRHFLLLEWAEGGNLVDFWRNNDTQNVTADQIREYLRQLTGLCSGLKQLHQNSIRHGNLKPTGILIFPTSYSEWLGVLKFASLSPPIHFQDTDARPARAKTARQYVAPEVARGIERLISRRADIWSMGCIIFESVVWLLYGKQGLEMFWANKRQPRCSEPHSLFFTLDDAIHPEVNEVVINWINHILGEDERLTDQPRTLVGDLLALVRDKLLVVEVDEPSNGPVRVGPAPRSQNSHGVANEVKINIRKVGSELEYNDTTGISFPILSICKGPGHISGPGDIRIGLPNLPSTDSPAYFTLLRSWVKDCDENHDECRPDRSLGPGRLPARLIEIQEEGMARIRELGPADRDKPEMFRYTAVSHVRGSGGPPGHFSTTPRNIESWRVGIPIKTLPSMLRDAIKVTRELGLRYIWIDTMCIIHDGELSDMDGELGDFFRLAYCVIAASRSIGEPHRFLGARPVRQHVALPGSSGGPFYVCELIDDFEHEILRRGLHQQGWRLPDRALARRTIYFGHVQTYCECGHGIRCETLTKMRKQVTPGLKQRSTSNEEAFLGDANFPSIATRASKDHKIRLLKFLYKRYSTLKLASDSDRPLAIASLEQRLLQAFNTKGGYGVMQRYLGPTLLWVRGSENALRRIHFSPQREAPSWSWMAYAGAIDFIDAPVNEVDWNGELGTPWTSTSNLSVNPELRAVAYDIDLRKSRSGVMFDCEAPPSDYTLKCVVVGKEKQKDSVAPNEQRHFVLVVEPRPLARGDSVFVRVGAGILSAASILFDRRGKYVWVY